MELADETDELIVEADELVVEDDILLSVENEAGRMNPCRVRAR